MSHSVNPIILLQMMTHYHNYKDDLKNRSFVFTKNDRLRMHKETDEEADHRKSYVPKAIRDMAEAELRTLLKGSLKGRLGKVYMDNRDQLRKLAVPLNAGVGDGGYGVLTTGSRVPIPEGKVIRAFTYWEKVDDIDLSCFAFDLKGNKKEFSWRSMWHENGSDIVFSGDQTNGYNGGSEYFDIDFELFRKNHPEWRYIVFCDNVYSDCTFRDCVAKAGFMLRDQIQSGEIFEPKTVQTSYILNADSSFSYLFAIDLKTREMVWLNLAREGRHAVAGMTDMDFILDKLDITSVFNVYDLIEASATEIVSNPVLADVIVSDNQKRFPDADNVIRSWDTNRFVELIQPK